jgi:hypothetical protein
MQAGDVHFDLLFELCDLSESYNDLAGATASSEGYPQAFVNSEPVGMVRP